MATSGDDESQTSFAPFPIGNPRLIPLRSIHVIVECTRHPSSSECTFPPCQLDEMKTPNVEKLKFAIPRFLTIFIFSADQSLKLTDGLYFIKQDWCIKKKKRVYRGFSQNSTSNPSRSILLFVSYLMTYVEEFVCGGRWKSLRIG